MFRLLQQLVSGALHQLERRLVGFALELPRLVIVDQLYLGLSNDIGWLRRPLGLRLLCLILPNLLEHLGCVPLEQFDVERDLLVALGVLRVRPEMVGVTRSVKVDGR